MAYTVIRKGEAFPSANEILATGKKADPSNKKSYIESSLESNTAYVVVAAASYDSTLSEVTTADATTAKIKITPTISLSSGELYSDSFTFVVETANADAAAWICVEATAEIPDAETIAATGTAVDDLSEPATYEVKNLDAEREYVVAAVASNADGQSPVATLHVTTTRVAPPLPYDFYYSDGTWSSGSLDPVEGKTCIGIVFLTARPDALDDCKYKLKDGVTPLAEVRGYVIALDDANPAGKGAGWGSWDKDGDQGAGTSADATDYRGYSNTKSITAKAIAKSGALSADNENNYPAVYYTTILHEENVPAPTSSSGWFLPSCGQMRFICKNRVPIEEQLHKLCREDIGKTRDCYWTSTEALKSSSRALYAYYVDFHHGYDDQGGFWADYRKRDEGQNVRSILVF